MNLKKQTWTIKVYEVWERKYVENWKPQVAKEMLDTRAIKLVNWKDKNKRKREERIVREDIIIVREVSP
jgi:hypothetical protein